MLRRRLLVAPAALLASSPGLAQPQAPPLRFGVDRSLAASGLAASLQRAFGADTGIAINRVVAPALALLDAVRDGEVDVALANAPEAEAGLERQTLVHDRRPIAFGDFVLVGPAPRRGTPAAADRDPLAALARLRDAAETAAAPGLVFLSAGDGSGAHLAEQALWRGARIAPKPPWYATADARRGSFVRQARERGAFAVVERGEWLAEGGPPLAIVAEGGDVLAETVHAMRSFRASHPAAKIFLAWIGGGHGRAVVARQRGYRVAR